MKNKKEIKSLLSELKEVHELYSGVDNTTQIELFEASKVLVDRLESLGVGRVWSETYICFGDAFLIHEHGRNMEQLLVKLNA